jgi:hypothetical protein
MGGGGSKPPPPPTVVEQPPPAGSDERSVVYPDRPNEPRLDGLTRALANDCAPGNCILEVVPGISSSSVRLSREFGVVSENQCRKYTTDKKRVDDRMMSFQDFLNRLQSGAYLRNLGNGYCEQVELPADEAAKTKSMREYDENKLRSVRIQKIESAGFSANTKARFTPSIPLKMMYGGKEITVSTMTLYHPCPLRIESVQADAVLSLNDPSFGDPAFVVLVPLVGRNSADPSISFFEKIAPEIVTVAAEDPASGQYLTRDIPTGANWSLSKLFGISAGKGGNVEVMNGHYRWKGMPALERTRVESGNTITYSWEPSGKATPTYIMMDTPVAINPSDLATITQRLPVSAPADSIHAVLYSGSDIMNRGIVHKAGPVVPCSAETPARESFTNADLNAITNESCDSWETWAQTAEGNGYTTEMIITLIFNVALTIAAAVGAYIALVAVAKFYDVELRGLSETIGKIIGVYAKDLKQKVAFVKNAVGNLRSAAANPGAAARGFAMDSAQNTTGQPMSNPLASMRMSRR